MKEKDPGFTLTELLIVMVIPGVLAAFALPRFAQLQAEARAASLEGLAGSLRSASAMVHALAMAQDARPGGTVTIKGNTVQLVNSYPTADTAINNGIAGALANPLLRGYTIDASNAGGMAGASLVISNGAGNVTQCNVMYVAPSAEKVPQVTVDTSDCT